MIPLGRTLYLWRIERGMTQEDLALRTGISRPNLSMIEQGVRDITVQTLRRLARALEIQPGILADGIPPRASAQQKFPRESLDRVARWILGQPEKLSKRERRLAFLIKPLVSRKMTLGEKVSSRLPRTAREEKQNWLSVRAEFDSSDVENVISRVSKSL